MATDYGDPNLRRRLAIDAEIAELKRALHAAQQGVFHRQDEVESYCAERAAPLVEFAQRVEAGAYPAWSDDSRPASALAEMARDALARWRGDDG